MSVTTDDRIDVAIVGAGIAGLACARDLVAAGLRVVVLEKSRGVGGRCATRRLMGQPVDIGLTYYHGDDPSLLAALAAVPATVVPGWPLHITGAGSPCHPAAFRPGQRRIAFAEGVNVFPKHLARDLDITLGARVSRVHALPGRVELDVEDGPSVVARDVVLTLPAPQAQAILPQEHGLSLRAVHNLLEHVTTHPCITLVLGFPASGPAPDFDIHYPERSPALKLIAHDSSKRVDPTYRVLVVQAHAEWSRSALEEPPETWRAALIEETARVVGPWVREPAWTEVQRWRYAKVDLATEVAAPMLFGLPGGGRLGLASEAFTLEAGVQGAYRAGRGLARRLLEDHAPRG